MIGILPIKRLTYLLIGFLVLASSCTQKAANESKNIVSSSVTIKGNILIYSTWDKKIVVEDIAQSKILYNKALVDICYPKPILKKEYLYFPLSNEKFVCVNIKTNKLTWELSLPGRCNGIYMINNIILMDIKHHGIVGCNLNNGKLLYEILYHYNKECAIPDLSLYRISFDSNNFYLNNWQCNTLSSFNSSTGKQNWTKNFGDGQSNTAFSTNGLFLGINRVYQGGEIYLIDSVSGNVLFKRESLFEQNFNPIFRKNKVYYYTYDAKMHAFDVLAKRDSIIFHFEESQDVSGNQMFLVNDNLYYNREKEIYALNLNSYVLKIVGHTEKDICGVALNHGSIKFIY